MTDIRIDDATDEMKALLIVVKVMEKADELLSPAALYISRNLKDPAYRKILWEAICERAKTEIAKAEYDERTSDVSHHNPH